MSERERLRDDAAKAEDRAKQKQAAAHGTMAPSERRRYKAEARAAEREAAALRAMADRAR
jgi:hypothetical protein